MNDKNFLFVIGKTDPRRWSAKQKEGFQKIEFQSFPEIDPIATVEDIDSVTDSLQTVIEQKQKYATSKGANAVFMLQGDFAICKRLFLKNEDKQFIFPIVHKNITEIDGKQKINFNFINWRH